MNALKDLAIYAAQYRIRGRSYKRNSLLKPLDIILDELDRCPNPKDNDELALVRAGTKGLILDHVKRVAKGVQEDAVYQYVEMFFEDVLIHPGNVNRLLQRERLIRSAYLVYMREALANIFIEKGKAKTAEEAIQAIEKAETQDEGTGEIDE